MTDRKTLRIALAGNPNCGKTTIFNAMTGARQKVGNYPGVTVEWKRGTARRGDLALDSPCPVGSALFFAHRSIQSVIRESV